MIGEISPLHSLTEFLDFYDPSAGFQNCGFPILAPRSRYCPSGIRGRIVAMFDSYSIRAKQVIFLTRLESGARGAQMLDVDDLVAGLITEDQNAIPSALARLGMTGEFMNSPEHYPFLSPDIANSVLESIHQSLPRSQQVPISTDMPISSGLQQILSAASDLRKKLQSKEVTPLPS